MTHNFHPQTANDKRLIMFQNDDQSPNLFAQSASSQQQSNSAISMHLNRFERGQIFGLFWSFVIFSTWFNLVAQVQTGISLFLLAVIGYFLGLVTGQESPLSSAQLAAHEDHLLAGSVNSTGSSAHTHLFSARKEPDLEGPARGRKERKQRRKQQTRVCEELAESRRRLAGDKGGHHEQLEDEEEQREDDEDEDSSRKQLLQEEPLDLASKSAVRSVSGKQIITSSKQHHMAKLEHAGQDCLQMLQLDQSGPESGQLLQEQQQVCESRLLGNESLRRQFYEKTTSSSVARRAGSSLLELGSRRPKSSSKVGGERAASGQPSPSASSSSSSSSSTGYNSDSRNSSSQPRAKVHLVELLCRETANTQRHHPSSGTEAEQVEPEMEPEMEMIELIGGQQSTAMRLVFEQLRAAAELDLRLGAPPGPKLPRGSIEEAEEEQEEEEEEEEEEEHYASPVGQLRLAKESF